ncbi:PAQR family membrane homeostasis protein TrhA [Virgibacillus flavescens]|uniref:PAQR family membrane homeostasis protein TrhA n=1 Tax=Virgibacillus flavescens TaxID=1611422 RepID=UPI003D345986
MKMHTFTREEEIVHAITHGIGALLSIVALVLLISYASVADNAWNLITVIVFGITMLFMYISSTVMHILLDGKWKDIFQIFDHSSIYLFIAGTYTPLLLSVIGGKLGWILFGIIWGMAIIGVIFKIFFVEKFVVISTLMYILMGWIIVFAWDPLIQSLNESGVLLLIIGGVFYTVGAIFYVWRGFPYHHAVWHLFVLAGSTFHFLTIFYYVI